MKIQIKNSQKKIPVKNDEVVRCAEITLREEGCCDGELSILLVDNREITKLNQHFRNTDRATDVLAFSMREGAFAELSPEILGDVAVSAEMACERAGEYEHTPNEELCLYIIHGILHLLGHDDTTPEKAAQMKKREHEILETVVRKENCRIIQ